MTFESQSSVHVFLIHCSYVSRKIFCCTSNFSCLKLDHMNLRKKYVNDQFLMSIIVPHQDWRRPKTSLIDQQKQLQNAEYLSYI